MLAFVLAATLACADLCTAEAAYWYDDLLAEGGYGRLPEEKAAFLIRERDGSLTISPWAGREYRRARFRGAIPDRTIAIIHTHPKGEPLPSTHDRKESRRLRMPVIVITPESVIAAKPDGTELVIRSRR